MPPGRKKYENFGIEIENSKKNSSDSEIPSQYDGQLGTGQWKGFSLFTDSRIFFKKCIFFVILLRNFVSFSFPGEPDHKLFFIAFITQKVIASTAAEVTR